MYTVALKIQETFELMSNGKYREFAEELYSTLYFMALRRRLSYETLSRIERVLWLKNEFLKLEKNPDDTYSVYEDEKLVDTFSPREVFMWLLMQLMKDEMLSGGEDFESGKALNDKMRGMLLPSNWSDVYARIGKNMVCPIVAEGYIYYLELTPWGSYDLKRMKYISELIPEYDDVEIIFSGVEKQILFNHKSGGIYCGVNGVDAYLRYDVGTGKKEVVYQAELIGVGKNGVEWFRNRENTICCYLHGELRRYKDILDTAKLQIVGDRLKVMPTYFSGDTFKPYMIDYEGVCEVCSQREARDWIWQRMIAALNFEEEDVWEIEKCTDVFRREEFLKAPYPFTVQQIMDRINQLTGVHAFEKIRLKTLLEEYEDGDVIEFLYKNWVSNYSLSFGKTNLESGKIGSFTEENGELIADFDSILNGKIDEKKVYRDNVQRYEGQIYYDREFQEYVVCWSGKRKFTWLKKLEELVGASILFMEEEQEDLKEKENKKEEKKHLDDWIKELMLDFDPDDLPFS